MNSANIRKIAWTILPTSIAATDLTTKHMAQNAFLLNSSNESISNYRSESSNVFIIGSKEGSNWLQFDLTYVRNPGAAWGFLADAPEAFRLILFNAVTIVATVLIIRLLQRSTPTQTIHRTSLLFILGGALGNGIDRFARRFVIDWIHFSWNIFSWEYSFPVFNAADIAINIGVFLFIISNIRTQPRQSLAAQKG
jgi:signal peptidase II